MNSLIVLAGGPYGGVILEDKNPPDVFIVNQKYFYKKTDRGELVEFKKNRMKTATIYEIDFRLSEQTIQWSLPGLNL